MATVQESFQNSFANFNKKMNSSSYFGESSGRESQESLLGSLQARASAAMGSIGVGANTDSDCFGITSMQRYMLFFMMLGASVLFFMIALFSLPLVLFNPGKFALSYTIGSLLFMGAFTVMNGYKAQFKQLVSPERVQFTIVYFGALIGTLYFSVVSPSYIAIVIFTVAQFLALGWYMRAYLSGSPMTLSWFSSAPSIGLPV